MRILVTDAQERAALAAVRSLGRAGHEVLVGAESRPALATASRFCTRAVLLPTPLTAPREFLRALLSEAGDERIDMILPITDASLSIVLEHRAAVEARGIQVPFPSHDTYLAISDKRRVLARARELGIATPAQVVVENADRAELIEENHLLYPVVFKPSRSVVGSGRSRRKATVQYATEPAQLLEMLDELRPEAYPVLLQERIVGHGVGVFLLRWQGQIVAAFAHRRLRERPPSGGVSVLRESHPMDSDLYAQSVMLLKDHDWCGPAMVEYKVSGTTGTPYLMEVNGRYWGSLQLAIDAGVDFPTLHVAAASGADVDPVVEYPAGVTTRWLLGDVDHLLARLLRFRDELGVPDSRGGRTRALSEFLHAFRPGVRGEVLRWYDPVPGLVELAVWFRNLGKGVPTKSP